MMAKKIIQEGLSTFTASCGECATRFRCEREDVHRNYIHDGEWVGCPKCGHACRHVGNGDSYNPKHLERA